MELLLLLTRYIGGMRSRCDVGGVIIAEALEARKMKAKRALESTKCKCSYFSPPKYKSSDT